VKKTASIFLLVLMVSIQTPLGQLFKLPLLIEHYIKHQKQDGVSLIDFLEAHYASNHKDADLPEDEQLPFKNATFQNIGYAIVTPIVQTDEVALLATEKKIVLPVTYTPQQYLGSIFHPPRV
jgi:hypothetical protein